MWLKFVPFGSGSIKDDYCNLRPLPDFKGCSGQDWWPLNLWYRLCQDTNCRHLYLAFSWQIKSWILVTVNHAHTISVTCSSIKANGWIIIAVVILEFFWCIPDMFLMEMSFIDRFRLPPSLPRQNFVKTLTVKCPTVIMRMSSFIASVYPLLKFAKTLLTGSEKGNERKFLLALSIALTILSQWWKLCHGFLWR